MDINNLIRKHVLFNAYKFSKANSGSVIGKLIAEHNDIKSRLKELMPIINEQILMVNQLSKDVIERELKEKYPDMLEKKEHKKKELKELEGAENEKVIMRFAPSPSGPMHLGHAMTGGLVSVYTRKYKGKFILRIEDTNADKIYEPAYDQLKEDANWLFGNVSEFWIQSDRIEIYYDYAKQLIKKDAAYVCTCDPDKFKELLRNKKACPCRSLSIDEHIKRWNNMLDKDGFREGQAVLRAKTNIEHKNPAMRDFPLARIKLTPHPRTGEKYRVWPLMNLSVFVDDVEAGMTHIIRAKDHMDNAKRQEYLYNALGKKIPKTYFTGRYNFNGLELSASKTREKIEQGIYSGWDDIRLPFILPLRKRGYQNMAFLKMTEQIGLTNVDKTVDVEEFFKSLNSLNKEIIDPIAYRYFFIKSPIEINIRNTPEFKVELDLHPDSKKGGRTFNVNGNFYIEKSDYDKIKDNEIVRLMDCLNFKKEGNEFIFISKSYDDFKDKGKLIIHWLPKQENTNAKLRFPDNSIVDGLAEKRIRDLNEDFIVQFERIGFARLDNKENLEFWFAHK